MIHVGIDLHSRNMTLVAVNDNEDLICEIKTVTKGEEYKGCKGKMTKISTQNYGPQPISSNA